MRKMNQGIISTIAVITNTAFLFSAYRYSVLLTWIDKFRIRRCKIKSEIGKHDSRAHTNLRTTDLGKIAR